MFNLVPLCVGGTACVSETGKSEGQGFWGRSPPAGSRGRAFVKLGMQICPLEHSLLADQNCDKG